MSQCLQCSESCKNQGLIINRINCYKRDIKNKRFIVNANCNLCNRCINICPIQKTINGEPEGNGIEEQINNRVRDCNFCILCAGQPACIDLTDVKEPGLIPSVFEYFNFKLRG